MALERIRQGGETRAAEIADRVNPPASTSTRLGAAFAPGDRVFDTVTGQLGTFVYVTPIGTGFQANYVINLDAGDQVVRRPTQLIKRPTPPAGRE